MTVNPCSTFHRCGLCVARRRCWTGLPLFVASVASSSHCCLSCPPPRLQFFTAPDTSSLKCLSESAQLLATVFMYTGVRFLKHVLLFRIRSHQNKIFTLVTYFLPALCSFSKVDTFRGTCSPFCGCIHGYQLESLLRPEKGDGKPQTPYGRVMT